MFHLTVHLSKKATSGCFKYFFIKESSKLLVNKASWKSWLCLCFSLALYRNRNIKKIPQGSCSHRHGISNFHIVPRVRCVCGVGGRFEFNPGVASPPILHAVDIPGNIQVNWLVPVLVGNCHVTSVVRESHTQVLYAIPTPAPFTGDNMQISFTLSLFLSVCEWGRTTNRKRAR